MEHIYISEYVVNINYNSNIAPTVSFKMNPFLPKHQSLKSLTVYVSPAK